MYYLSQSLNLWIIQVRQKVSLFSLKNDVPLLSFTDYCNKLLCFANIIYLF